MSKMKSRSLRAKLNACIILHDISLKSENHKNPINDVPFMRVSSSNTKYVHAYGVTSTDFLKLTHLIG